MSLNMLTVDTPVQSLMSSVLFIIFCCPTSYTLNHFLFKIVVLLSSLYNMTAVSNLH